MIEKTIESIFFFSSSSERVESRFSFFFFKVAKSNFFLFNFLFFPLPETHRAVLNQILRQSTIPLLEGPFAVLINHTRILDFDVKRKYFRSELDRCEEGHRRDEVAVHVQRSNVFEDSFRELFRRTSEEWKNRFYIVFEGNECHSS